MPTKLPSSPEETLAFLQHYGAIEVGHFLLASGRHSGHYVQKGKFIQYPVVLQDCIQAIVPQLNALGKIDVVLSPAVGGIPVGQQVGLALECRAIYSERDAENRMILKRGFEIKPGERVLMVEDVITTGGTLRELKDFVLGQGAELAGVFTVVNRSGKNTWDQWPLVSCMAVDFPTYAPDEVPEDLAALPLVRPGTKKA